MSEEEAFEFFSQMKKIEKEKEEIDAYVNNPLT